LEFSFDDVVHVRNNAVGNVVANVLSNALCYSWFINNLLHVSVNLRVVPIKFAERVLHWFKIWIGVQF